MERRSQSQHISDCEFSSRNAGVFLSEVAPDAQSKFYLGLSLTLAPVRTEKEAKPKSSVWTVNEDLHQPSVRMYAQGGEQVTDWCEPFFIQPSALTLGLDSDLSASSSSCLIFSTISQLNQPTNHHPTSSAIIDHSQLLLPQKMFCWSLEKPTHSVTSSLSFSLGFKHSICWHIQFTPNDWDVTYKIFYLFDNTNQTNHNWWNTKMVMMYM